MSAGTQQLFANSSMITLTLHRAEILGRRNDRMFGGQGRVQGF